MGAGDLSGATEAGSAPVSVGVVFERFPASIRGAVVVRGTDPDPHQVELVGAWVAEAHAWSRPVHGVAIDPVTVDMAPRSEVLIPFDVPLAGMGPGWYVAAAEVEVDGKGRVRGPEDGKRFLVPWPGDQVRKGLVPADLTIRVPGSDGAVVERLECKGDRAIVRWRHAAGEEAEFGDLRVAAGSRRLPELEASHDAATGARVTVVYPILKAHRRLTFELDRRRRPDKPPQRGKWSATLDLD
ncbi:MAG: hypothetical protein ACRDI0_09445 [Actinomycetota bacterium]